MTEHEEREVRWEPIAGMPEGGCGDFVVVSERMGHLTLRAYHDYDDLLIDFLDVRAFRVYWDGDAASNNVDRPRSSFLLVENSRWLTGNDFLKNYGPHGWDVPYQHYRVLTSERHIDVIARSAEAHFAEGLPASGVAPPAKYLLRIEPGFTKSISAIRELVGVGVPLITAKRQIERLLIRKEILVEVPAPKNPSHFESELLELGVVALRQPRMTTADADISGS